MSKRMETGDSLLMLMRIFIVKFVLTIQCQSGTPYTVEFIREVSSP